jgi:hypothetical protein
MFHVEQRARKDYGVPDNPRHTIRPGDGAEMTAKLVCKANPICHLMRTRIRQTVPRGMSEA